MDKILKTDKIIGKPIKIDDRTLYPIIQISTIKNKNFITAWIHPIAIVITEPTKKYIIQLTDEDIKTEEILEMILNNE
ncbi:MAG TPA: hypothetical protein PLO64_05955 [Methanothermobacter sp.]|nr:conserved hypothetical protein [Methanothermobacter sp. MT-2]HHW05102.1 hypothetical protein [Methanothermobacter sp.]HOK16865.1 hypothetical protein [Defluviitoga tunisiensis]HOL69456.1 hypothetical protein [Methanothermobacter sp.]HPQ05390.1 hypothetical protein [Methanothermobacter sp.]